jgi:hypothetical protein
MGLLYLYMFRATMCPSSGEITINTAPGNCHSVWMTVWYAPCIPDGHPHTVTNTRCRIDTVNSPDDGHIGPETCVE